LVFKKNANFLRQKLGKIAENCDHNIDPWFLSSFPLFDSFHFQPPEFTSVAKTSEAASEQERSATSPNVATPRADGDKRLGRLLDILKKMS
jgi:hypothetical protein